LDRANVTALVQDLDRALRGRPTRVYVDLEAVESFDSAGLGGVVASMRQARDHGCEVKLKGVSQSMLDYFSLVSIERLVGKQEPVARPDPVTRLGGAVEPMVDGTVAVFATAYESCRELFVGPFRRRFLRLDRTAIEVDHCAAGALPIIALIAFLLGLILAMQAYVQLRVWGAEIYIADMVGVSVLAEIGPLMTAIVLAMAIQARCVGAARSPTVPIHRVAGHTSESTSRPIAAMRTPDPSATHERAGSRRCASAASGSARSMRWRTASRHIV